MRGVGADEYQPSAESPLRQRNAERRRRRRARGHARNNLEAHAGGFKGIHLFPKTPKNSRVAAFQPNHSQPTARGIDHAFVDLFLRDLFDAAALADVDHLSGANHSQDGIGDEIVMQDQLGALKQPIGPARKQLGVARTGADKIDGCLWRRVHSFISAQFAEELTRT